MTPILLRRVRDTEYKNHAKARHTHTLDQQGTVLIVENQNTCLENSPIQYLSEWQLEERCRIHKLIV